MSVNPEDDDIDLDALEDVAPAWPAREFELILRRPVTLPDGAEISSIMLREPTGAEWEEIMEHPVRSRRRFGISRVGGVPMKTCAAIGIGDLVRGEAYLTSFFEVGQAIGAR